MRRHLHAYTLYIQPAAENPHPRAYDTVVHIGWLLHREAVAAVARV